MDTAGTWRADADLSPAYSRVDYDSDFDILLPEAGGTWIGQPFNHNTRLDACLVRRNSTGEVRTAQEDYAAPDGWLNWNMLWWNSTQDSWSILALHGGDDNALHPWYGYLVWSNVRDTTLIVPGQ